MHSFIIVLLFTFTVKEESFPVQESTERTSHPSTVGELFKRLNLSEEEELLFIQLPDTIPGPGKAASEKLPKMGSKAEDKSGAQLKTQVSPHCLTRLCIQ